jgi:hypothetical protein
MNDPSNPLNQLMRIQIEPHADLRAAPRSLFRGERRIDIIEIMDQWYGPDYRYVKVRAHDGSMYILRFGESRDECEIIMFSSARAQGVKTEQHDLARSAQSRQ